MLQQVRAKLATMIAPKAAEGGLDYLALAAAEGKSATRANQLPPSVHGIPYSHTSDQSLAETLRKVLNSPVTLACITAYVRRMQQLTFRIQEWNAETRRYEFVNYEHPAEERWDQPATWCTQKEMLSMVGFGMFGTGNWLASFINSDRKRGKLTYCLELSPLDPDFVDPVPDVIDVLSGYWVRQGDPRTSVLQLLMSLDTMSYFPMGTGNGRFVNRKEMIHAKFATGKNPWWGLSPIQAAALAIDTGAVAQAWNRSLVGNRLEEGGVLQTEVALTREDIDELRDHIYTQISGAGAGKPLILTRGLQWKSTNRAPKEMDYVGTDKRTDWKICAALGVHPVVIGQMDDATLNNAEMMKRDFWLDSVIPFTELILDAANNNWVWPTWGRNVRLWYDTSNVLALQEKREEKIEVFTALHERGYPANMLNAWLELGLPDLPIIGDKSYLKAGLHEIGGESDAAEPAAAEASDEQTEKTTPTKRRKSAVDDARDAYWATFEKRRERFYARFEKRIENLLSADLDAALEEAQAGFSGIAYALDKRVSHWEQELENLWTETGHDFGQWKFDEIAAKGGLGADEAKAFWSWTRSATDYVRDLVRTKAKGIVETTKTWLNLRAEQTIGQGRTVDELADAIQLRRPEFTRNRAVLIARSEVISASNYGAREAAVRSGRIKTKIWLTSRDHRVRETHQALEGQKRPLNQPYSNGLMYPGDPNGPASETVMCRCVELYEV